MHFYISILKYIGSAVKNWVLAFFSFEKLTNWFSVSINWFFYCCCFDSSAINWLFCL